MRRVFLLALAAVAIVDARVYFADEFQQVAAKGTSAWRQVVIQSDAAHGASNERYSTETFETTPRIESLFIVNKIDALRPRVFQSLSHLRVLHLDENTLPVLKAGDFDKLHLDELLLTNNSINSIEPGAFGCSPITFIDLSENCLQEIPANVFNGSSLRKLILAGNMLTGVAERAFSRNLTHLDLSLNRIRSMAITVFEDMYALRYLNLSRNQLPTVTSALWLQSLEVLDLSHNRIRLLVNGAFEDYPKLRVLHLENNEILYLNPRSFTKPSPIEHIHLERNMFTFLPGEVGELFGKLKSLRFGGNPWSCACLASIEGFVKASNIGLSDCEKHYFTNGRQAVCLTAYSECYGNETLLLLGHPEIYQSLIDDYTC